VNNAATAQSSRPEQLCFLALLVILVWAPLPFGSNREWAGALLALLMCLLSSCWLVLYLAGRVHIDAAIWRWGRLPFAILVCVQAWVAFQLLPLPTVVLELMSPQAAQWHFGEGWKPLSLDIFATQYYLLRGVCISLGFFMVLALVNTYSRLRLLLQVLVFSGTVQAVYGSLMVLSGWELGFFVEKYTGIGVATGTFINRNHFAGYLVMCLSVGTGLLLSQLVTESGHSWRQRLRMWLQLMLSSKIRLRLYLAIMVIGLVLSRSRTGNIAFFAALIVGSGVALYLGRKFSWKMAFFLASLLLIDLLILGQWFGIDRLAARLEAVQGQEMLELSRYSMNIYTLDYVKDFWLTGSGGGSFYGIFSTYQGQEFPGFFQHAHNDYLEFMAELGLPVFLLLVLLVLMSAWQALQLQRLRHTGLYRGVGFAVFVAIIWLAVHSTTDFNLQIPSNGLTFAVILAMAYVARALPGVKSAA
jgi:O-antigen ligase